MTSAVGNAFFGVIEVGLIALCAIKISAIKKDIRHIINEGCGSLEKAPVINVTHVLNLMPENYPNGWRFWNYTPTSPIASGQWIFKPITKQQEWNENGYHGTYFVVEEWEITNLDPDCKEPAIHTEKGVDANGKSHISWQGYPTLPTFY